MSHCYYHALSSVRRFGGVPGDYLPVHEWFDQAKIAWNHPTHRALLHNEFGVKLVIEIRGENLQRSDGVVVSTEEVVRQHIREDLGRVPTLEEWFSTLNVPSSMRRASREHQEISEFFDAPRVAWDDPRADLLLHNSVGIYLCEQKLGLLTQLHGGKSLPTRVLAEKLVMDRMGGIPTVRDVVGGIPLRHQWQRIASAPLSKEFGDGYA